MDDLISRQVAIDVEGIDEQIRCEMCRNPKHTDRGCDGNCKYDEKLYERIMQILGERIKPLPESRKGNWIYFLGTGYGNPYGHFECDLCGDGYGYKTDFCPSCGADMREG